MKTVVYAGPYPAVTLPDGTVCVAGEPVSVPADVAVNLMRQGFRKPSETTKDEG